MTQSIQLTVKRRGLASTILALVRPGHARAATLHKDVLSLVYPLRTVNVPIGEISAVETRSFRRSRTIRIHLGRQHRTISGLSRRDANALIEALKRARTRWWRETLGHHADAIEYVGASLKEISDSSAYRKQGEISTLQSHADSLGQHFPGRWPDQLEQDPLVLSLMAIRDFLADTVRFRSKVNLAYIETEMIRSQELFDRIETLPLTEEQRRAVVVDEAHNLVVAAAGSGKTSVIVAKAAWLVQRGFRTPSELLLLAFAKDAQEELRERVVARVCSEDTRKIAVRTFHGLGLSIIGEAEGKLPTLAKVAEERGALPRLMQQTVGELIASPNTGQVIARWFRDEFAPYKSQDEFQTYGDYWNYIQKHEIRSLKGDEVKSFEECEIANYLFLSGIPYEYEPRYEHDTATSRKRQYHPDFYLTGTGIYIEHLALSASGRTPRFINQQDYVDSLEWKRSLHKEHGTVLIETFSHERSEGRLLRNLEAKLKARGVTFSPITPDKIFETLNQQNRIGPFARLLATFLQHFKGSGLTIQELAARSGRSGDSSRARAFLQVFRPIFERYEEALRRRGEIDFHDMIARATEHVASGRYRSPFGYILIDEFQDISPARAKLLKALLEQRLDAQLFAVGDDWQAIFRFAGSDIAIMRDFEDCFGDSERIDLETTFRCCDRISDVATKFVLGNPSQIRKNVRSVHTAEGTSVFIGLAGEESPSPLAEALDRVAEHAAKHPEPSNVLLLGRYRHQRPTNLAHLANRHPRLRLSFMTAHGSKGSQADYVLVLGLCAGRYGFPSEVTDDPLLDLVLAKSEDHPNAEERRLFYVALTRAKRQVYLLADEGPPSAFVEELIRERYDVTVFGRPPERDVSCPRCVRGRLVRRDNARNRRTFYGCSNYPLCDHTQQACPVCNAGLLVKDRDRFRCQGCGATVEACPVCDGWLRPRIGKYGRFLGCSNYPDCDHTREINQRRRYKQRAT
ncbi:MAG: UvrD-helicase domain-containing protein [Gammaproteobacteria bacterium]|nr:UvrD-helicase domain-containing protein [Gammaproteobacteria bacterium]